MTDPQETIYAAFAAAQADFRPVIKNRVNPAFHSKYADLQAILDATKPALAAHGLALTQRVEMSAGVVRVETLVYHASGDAISSGVLEMAVQAGKGQTSVQAAGSTMSYARRYSLAAFLSVAADDDDDGNGAGTPAPDQGQGFVLTQPLVDAAKAAASGGVEEYKKYYQSRPLAERTELAKSGWHKSLYEQAKAADAAKEAAQ